MNRTPLIIAIVLLLLPVLYVGSYLALVVPKPSATVVGGGVVRIHVVARYRIDWHLVDATFFPLEQIDRKVRPRTWEPWEGALPE